MRASLTSKQVTNRHPELRQKVERALQQLIEDPFNPKLHTHKLKGELSGVWACTVDYNNRILFEFVKNPGIVEEEILRSVNMSSTVIVTVTKMLESLPGPAQD